MNFKNGSTGVNSGNSRFGVMPLPVEDSSTSTNGELMVSRSTGHMYVRNGGKDISKTVEIEEFLEAFRVGCINMIRNSGDFKKYALEYNDAANKTIEGDWKAINNNISIVDDPEIDRRVLKISTTGGKSSIFNRMYKYHETNKKIFKSDARYTLSIIAKASKDMNIDISIGKEDKTNSLTSTCNNIKIKTTWNSYEITLLGKDLSDPTNTSGLLISNISEDSHMYIGDIQLEPGDRSSAWRHSWYDYYQEMGNLNGDLKIELINVINNAITECKEYTDGEISDLMQLVKIWITEAYNKSIEYTDGEIDRVNTTIVREIDRVEDSIRDLTCHINLGQFDWRKYVLDGESNLLWDNIKKSVYIESKHAQVLDIKIPVSETSKYFIEIDYEYINGNKCTIYTGISSYDEYGIILGGNNEDSYYNFFDSPKIMTNNLTNYTPKTIYEGYASASSPGDRFDSRASYFSPVVLPYWGESDTTLGSKLYIRSIKVFEIPSCLWNALDAVTLYKDGLMTSGMLLKLNGIEEGANKYIHPINDGNLHVPATGSENNNKWLKAGSTPGSISWRELPTDIDTVDGKHANEFVWKCDDTQKVSNGVITYNNLQVLNTGSANNSNTNIKLNFLNCSGLTEYKLSLKLAIFSKSGVSEIAISYTYYGNVLENINILNSDSDLIRSISIVPKTSTGFEIYLASNNVNNMRTLINIDSLIIQGNNLPTNTLTVTSTWVGSIVGVNHTKSNIGLDAGKLDGRDSSSFANMESKPVDNYTANISVGEKIKSANIVTRADDKDSWVLLDNKGSTNTGIYFRNQPNELIVQGQVALPGDSFAYIKDNNIVHYTSMKGDQFHKGNLKSKNIDTGRYRLSFNNEDGSLDFIFE